MYSMYNNNINNNNNNNNNNNIKHSIDSLQKAAVLGTSQIIRKVQHCEAWSLSGGDHCWFKRITRKNRPVTRDIIITIMYCYNKNVSVKVISQFRLRINKFVAHKLAAFYM